MSRLLTVGLLCSLLMLGEVRAQTVITLVAPFDSSRTGSDQVGKKIGVILNLQIWQTLIKPSSGNGSQTDGRMIWDVFSPPPTNASEAERLALDYLENPQIVLWGRGWRYGDGNVVEAYLSIRSSATPRALDFDLWEVSIAGGSSFSVEYPHRQIEFAPIVLRADLLAELKDPAGLKLYVNRTGPETNGYVGYDFTAKQQGPESAFVSLPDGRRGWVRLPDLSRQHTEVVDFTGALIRIMRQDWHNARPLFLRVLANPRTPAVARIDSNLYLAVIAHHLGEDPISWVRDAYNLDPYSRTTIEYLCMVHLSAIQRMTPAERRGSEGRDRLKALTDIAELNRSLFPRDDPWLSSLQEFLTEHRP
jgi:hypothetical protein